MIPFQCGTCDDSYEVDDELAGKAIRCRTCSEWARVASLPAPAPEPPPIFINLPSDEAYKKQNSSWKWIPPQPTETWYYRYIKGYASFNVIAGVILCIVVFVFSLHLGRRGDDAGIALMFSGIILSVLLMVGATLMSAVLLLLVDIGRSLREIKDKKPTIKDGAKNGD